MTNKDIGKIIQFARVKEGLTQKELASILNVSPMAVSGWERGNRGLTVTKADIIFKKLGISITIGRKGE